MILSGNSIQSNLLSGNWNCNVDIHKLHFNPNSVDVTLSPWIYVTKSNTEVLDPFTSNIEDYFDLLHINTYILKPQEFILASTNEAFNTDALCSDTFRLFTQLYEGRSTLARIGLMSHISAGFGDYGFKGCFTLEIVNHAPYPIKLHANMRIGQIYFQSLNTPFITAQATKYEGYSKDDGTPELAHLGKTHFI